MATPLIHARAKLPGASGFFILSQSVGILSGLNEKELKNIL
jgi:hypothetical protein